MHPLKIFLLLILCCGAVAQAQDTTKEEQRLRSVEEDLKATEAEKAQLQQRQEATARELNSIRAKMIQLAQDIQAQETSLTTLESRLHELENEHTRLKATLGVRDEQLQQLAMALQRIALRPGDALSLSPLKPDDAVRTAILLRAAVPSVQTSAKKLEAELSDLTRVRADIESQQQKVAAANAGLIDKHKALENAENDKSKLQLDLKVATTEATAKAQKLANEASDLKDLVTKVLAARAEEAKRKEIQRQADAAKTAASKITLKPPAGIEPKTAKPETQMAALPPAASEPAPKPTDLKPFSQGRGTMPFPAVGTLKKRYGDPSDEPGTPTRGIIIATRANGQVIAPFDGVVAFAGPFRGYGLLLIIEHSEGYHTLLSGLSRIDCVLDQRVYAGEPVGVMNNESTADLYVELRHNGQPVNPLPWLNSRTGKNTG